MINYEKCPAAKFKDRYNQRPQSLHQGRQLHHENRIAHRLGLELPSETRCRLYQTNVHPFRIKTDSASSPLAKSRRGPVALSRILEAVPTTFERIPSLCLSTFMLREPLGMFRAQPAQLSSS